MQDKPSPLGKGLAALISEDAIKTPGGSYIPDLNVNLIVPNPDQPRLEISPESLIELADSIREHGIIEPLIVSKSKQDGKYTLIAGERRWKAAMLAKVDTVPVVVKESSPRQMLEMAIVENIQRKDLNPLEEALAFQQLHDDYQMTTPEIAKKVGIARPTVSNKMRLLNLPIELKEALLKEQISEGHARALLGLSNAETMVAALSIILKKNLSVRGTENLVRKLTYEENKYKNKVEANKAWSPRAVEISNILSSHLDLKIKLTRTRRGGKIVIPFKDDDELEEIFGRLSEEFTDN